MLDLTGVIGVGAIAATGLAVLPYRKRQLKLEIHSQLNNLRETLSRDLKAHFDQHLLTVISQVKSATSPFSVYVKTEGETLAKSKQRLLDCQIRISELSNKIDKV